MKNGTFLAIGLLVIASTFLIACGTGEGTGPSISLTRGLTAHSPIVIEGDSGFDSNNGVIGGSGTQSDPYIIEGWDIDATSTDFGVYIGNTTKHFTIRNCRIHGADNGNGEINIVTRNSNGITFNNVRNGKVQRNILYDNSMSDIHLYHSDLNVIEMNTISSRFGSSHILLEWSSNNTILLNECDPHYREWDPANGTVTEGNGIWVLYDSDDNLISYNILRNFTQPAIFISNNGCDGAIINYNVIQYSDSGIGLSGEYHEIMDNLIDCNTNTGIYADMLFGGVIGRNMVTDNGGSGVMVCYDGGKQAEGKNEILDNYILDNGLDGICAHGKDSTYRNNTVIGNNGDGVNIWRSNNHLYHNHVEGNKGYGFYIENRWGDMDKARNNIIHWNDILNNSSPSQGRDECNDNSWNDTKKGNYWSDHNGPDNNSDGLVDTPYIVQPPNAKADWRPVATRFNITTFGPIIPPRITTDDRTSAQVNTTYDATYEVYDPLIVSDPLQWTIRTNASWLQVSGSRIYGTPSGSDRGQYWVNVSVTDRDGYDRHDFVLTVLPIPGDENDPDNGTDPGNDTEPGDDQDNGTEPGDDNKGNGTEPGSDPVNDTTAGDDQDNGTVPGADDEGDDTIPDDDQGDQNDIWDEQSNMAPNSVAIDPPTGKIIAGRKFVLSAYAFDPDLESGDSLTFDWYIEGIGHVGSGVTVELALEQGKYTVILIATDHYGLRMEKSMDVTVYDVEDASSDPIFPLATVMVVIVLAVTMAAIFIFKKRQRSSEGLEETMDWDPDTSDSAPINIKTTSGNFNEVRTGPLRTGAGNDLRSFGGQMGVPSGPILSGPEERTLRDLRTDAMATKRSPMKHRKRELRDLLRRREGALDRTTYLVISSMLEE